ncbi:hypothetical protein [Acidicapsa acidisoli]|uniref:hypothetical protein n=1 Tax=Acidicapsa acidisoli TaxID=1615681 RepID=UPI0021DF60A8|nr:hypothetical protein [Acidicapsa acidisoli]
MVSDNEELYSFRIYIRQEIATHVATTIFLYWDTRFKDRALIGPWFYEHAAYNDLEGRLWIGRILDSCNGQFRYDWAVLRSEEIDRVIKDKIQTLSNSRASELQDFLEHSWKMANDNPSRASRAVFICQTELQPPFVIS